MEQQIQQIKQQIQQALKQNTRNRSEQIDQIAEALAKVQASMPAPEKNKHGNRGSYADLESMLSTAKKTCSEHGIAIYQHYQMNSGHIFLHSTLIHTSGQWLNSTLLADPIEDPKLSYWQCRTLGFTYTKKHHLEAQLGMRGDVED